MLRLQVWKLIPIVLICNTLYSDGQNLEYAPLESIHSGSSVHGLFDTSVKNDYITPRGLLVTNTGVTFQVLSLLFFDIYSNPDCWLQKAVFTTGAWNDIWTEQQDPYVGAWNELDWVAGITFNFANSWTFGVQFLGFLSPPHHFRAENNLEFLLAYDDAGWNFPVVFNPYLKWFWTMSGDSTVVTGKAGTYDIEIGMIPTYQACGFSILAPTWFTVGPSDFWAGGALALPSKNSNWGVFSTGLRSEVPLAWINPGNWSVYVGGQYYHLINDNLLQAQTITLGIDYDQAHRDVGVAYSGFMMKF